MTDGRHTNTRERILDAALDLMSERGYGAVSVRDLADAVGIKGASLYKHFAGKREAFDALHQRARPRISKGSCTQRAPTRRSTTTREPTSCWTARSWKPWYGKATPRSSWTSA